MEKIVSPCGDCYRKDRKVCFKGCRSLATYNRILNKTVGYPHEFLGMSTLEHVADGCFWTRPKIQKGGE